MINSAPAPSYSHLPVCAGKGKSGMVSTTKSGQQTNSRPKPKIKRLESQYKTDFKEETGTGTSYQISHRQYLQKSKISSIVSRGFSSKTLVPPTRISGPLCQLRQQRPKIAQRKNFHLTPEKKIIRMVWFGH